MHKMKTEKAALNMPNAIVVLGGGLTLDKNRKDIVVNEYTQITSGNHIAGRKTVQAAHCA